MVAEDVRHVEESLARGDGRAKPSVVRHIPCPMETEVRALLALESGQGPTRKILHENACSLFGL